MYIHISYYYYIILYSIIYKIEMKIEQDKAQFPPRNGCVNSTI